MAMKRKDPIVLDTACLREDEHIAARDTIDILSGKWKLQLITTLHCGGGLAVYGNSTAHTRHRPQNAGPRATRPRGQPPHQPHRYGYQARHRPLRAHPTWAYLTGHHQRNARLGPHPPPHGYGPVTPFKVGKPTMQVYSLAPLCPYATPSPLVPLVLP